MKLRADSKRIDDIPMFGIDIDIVQELSETLAKEIDKEIFNSLLEQNEKDNIDIIKDILPTKSISEVCKDLEIDDLKKEFSLKEKIRDWKINKFLD